MGMTSNEEDISRLTGLKIGQVLLSSKVYEAQRDGNRILDVDSGNFHLFPVILSEEEEAKDEWKKYLNLENEVFTQLRDKIDINVYDIQIGGEKGTLTGIPEIYLTKRYGLNNFFRFLEIKKDDRYYMILLKRFYIDKKKKVNCRFGEVQFWSSKNNKYNEQIEECENDISTYTYKSNGYEETLENIKKLQVHYPKSYRGQNEKMIRFSNTPNQVNMYNPKGIKSISSTNGEIESYADNILKAFKQYVSEIEKLDKK